MVCELTQSAFELMQRVQVDGATTHIYKKSANKMV